MCMEYVFHTYSLKQKKTKKKKRFTDVPQH